MAVKNDNLVGDAWVGHPYYEVIDNATDFEMKMRRLTKTVADKLGIPNAEEWLDAKAVKLKFLVRGPPPRAELFPKHRDFTVHHDYLPCYEGGPQARIRRRGRHGKWMYTHTVRRQEPSGEVVETRTNVSRHIYDQLLSQVAGEMKHHLFSYITVCLRLTERRTSVSRRLGGASLGGTSTTSWTSTPARTPASCCWRPTPASPPPRSTSQTSSRSRTT